MKRIPMQDQTQTEELINLLISGNKKNSWKAWYVYLFIIKGGSRIRRGDKHLKSVSGAA